MKTFSQVVQNLPPHLKQYVVDQDYSRYTPVDQATWRFILRQLKNYLSIHAHESYVEGLAKTGISVESIPRIEVMCEKLQEFGWMAVPVSGFIPPAAFMEMQSLSVLPIACDMRTIDHILYTPAPDIVHEAAGHAPILVDQNFADYLKEYAQIAKKAIISSEDLAQYEAIRDLSDIKEDPSSTAKDIAAAEKKLNDVNAKISHLSEAALLGRMNWWTAEYGLIGDVTNPKIFGAGLLSSVGEARQALSDKVKKLPLTVDCVKTSYDITEPQPQLFVTKNFSELTQVLHQLEDRLSFKKGGEHGLNTALQAKTVNTVELNSGLQISGKLAELLQLPSGEVFYYKFTGPVQLCEADKQLAGQGPEQHGHGFSSPLGLLRGSTKCLSEFSAEDLKQHGIIVGQKCELIFDSGVTVTGDVLQLTFSKIKKLMIVSFTNCTVVYDRTTLFSPDWGTFDMAVGSRAVSVFAGPADRDSYGMLETFAKKIIPSKKYSEKTLAKHNIYQNIRDLREGKIPFTQLDGILQRLGDNFPDEWLAYLEIMELTHHRVGQEKILAVCQKALQRIAKQSSDKQDYIQLGLAIAETTI